MPWKALYCKALGKDGLQENWIKAFNSLHDQLLNFLNLCLQSGKISDWIIWEKNVLIQKDLSKGTIPQQLFSDILKNVIVKPFAKFTGKHL